MSASRSSKQMIAKAREMIAQKEAARSDANLVFRK